MTGRHSVPGRVWWVDAGARTWVAFKMVTFVTGVLFYIVLISVFL